MVLSYKAASACGKVTYFSLLFQGIGGGTFWSTCFSRALYYYRLAGARDVFHYAIPRSSATVFVFLGSL